MLSNGGEGLVGEWWAVCVCTAVVQVHELEAQQAAVNAELNAIRQAVADDNEEFLVKGLKGVSAAQELISK